MPCNKVHGWLDLQPHYYGDAITDTSPRSTESICHVIRYPGDGNQLYYRLHVHETKDIELYASIVSLTAGIPAMEINFIIGCMCTRRRTSSYTRRTKQFITETISILSAKICGGFIPDTEQRGICKFSSSTLFNYQSQDETVRLRCLIINPKMKQCKSIVDNFTLPYFAEEKSNKREE
ncbi:hypothetical protein QE152_g24328 [Popillia japonica]|uniref:Uncharacterized protein n=1 Tax=Popillia japonica TaxID=7064 RepID=A0AAW1KG74_POPJA